MTKIIIVVLLIAGFQANAETIAKKILPPCDDSPNCVSSQSFDKRHYIPPFRISGDPNLAWAALRQAIIELDRIVITHETKTTLHAEATSLVLRFVDDVDAILDAGAGLIHIRSASRFGHSDFGVNRKRIESLRSKLRKLHYLG
jgi:uncharacterized protein (DUF1499 family)